MTSPDTSYTARTGFGYVFLITFAAMILASWSGFVEPMPTCTSTLITLSSGFIAALIGLRADLTGAIMALTLPLLLYFPVIFSSDVFAHALFNGCVLY